MASFIKAFQDGSKLISRHEDDAFDRVSSRWTVGFLIAVTLLITTKTYVGDAIDCYSPKEFTDQWVKYTDQVCWVSGTYYVPMENRLPGPEETPQVKIAYYQWVPIILAFSAFLFCVPGMFWNFINDSAGYNVKAIVETCKNIKAIDPAERDASISYLVNNMLRILNYRRPYKKRHLTVGKRYGRYIFLMFFVTKILYIGNAVGQIFLLNLFLGNSYHMYGWRAAADWNRDYTATPIFPRVTMCSFHIRTLGENLHKHAVQCVLPVNLFNERIFMVFWWWLVIVAGISTFGFLGWLLTFAMPGSTRNFCQKYLKIMGRYHQTEDLRLFADEFLRQDGGFTLRLIARNTNDIIVGEVVANLWDKYLETRKEKSSLSPEV